MTLFLPYNCSPSNRNIAPDKSDEFDSKIIFFWLSQRRQQIHVCPMKYRARHNRMYFWWIDSCSQCKWCFVGNQSIAHNFPFLTFGPNVRPEGMRVFDMTHTGYIARSDSKAYIYVLEFRSLQHSCTLFSEIIPNFIVASPIYIHQNPNQSTRVILNCRIEDLEKISEN